MPCKRVEPCHCIYTKENCSGPLPESGGVPVLQTTKPFDPTKKVQTRQGAPARIICVDRRGKISNDGKQNLSIVALVDCAGVEAVRAYYSDGKSPDMHPEHDLLNVLVDRYRWVTKTWGPLEIEMEYRTQEEAKHQWGDTVIGHIPETLLQDYAK